MLHHHHYHHCHQHLYISNSQLGIQNMGYAFMEEIHILTAFMEIIAQGEECTIALSHPKGYKDRSTPSPWNPKECPWLVGVIQCYRGKGKGEGIANWSGMFWRKSSRQKTETRPFRSGYWYFGECTFSGMGTMWVTVLEAEWWRNWDLGVEQLTRPDSPWKG